MSASKTIVIDFKTECISYHITLSSKVTIIKGHSGIGKTYLIDQLRAAGSALNNVSNDRKGVLTNFEDANTYLRISDGYYIVVLPDTDSFLLGFSEKEYLESSQQDRRQSDRLLKYSFVAFLKRLVSNYADVELDKVIFICDENASYMSYRAFQGALKEVPSLFLFVNRDAMFAVPCCCGSIMTFKTVGTTNINIPYFEQVSNNIGCLHKKYTAVFCEDTLTGLKVFKQVADDSDSVDTFEGKDYLLHYWDKHTNSLFILDGLGCGATLDRLLNYISEGKIHNQNGVYLIGSFEHMLLTSEFAKRGNAKSGFVLREPAINEWNVEEFYAKELSRFCVEALKMRMGYHKQDLASCFVEACKSSVKDCKGLLDLTQSSCDYRIPGTLQDKFKTLVPADLYEVLTNLKDNSKLTYNQSQVRQSQSQDSTKLSEQPDTNSGKTDSKESESDITTNLFGC